MRKKDTGEAVALPGFWVETVDSVKHECRFDSPGRLTVSSLCFYRASVF